MYGSGTQEASIEGLLRFRTESERCIRNVRRWIDCVIREWQNVTTPDDMSRMRWIGSQSVSPQLRLFQFVDEVNKGYFHVEFDLRSYCEAYSPQLLDVIAIANIDEREIPVLPELGYEVRTVHELAFYAARVARRSLDELLRFDGNHETCQRLVAGVRAFGELFNQEHLIRLIHDEWARASKYLALNNLSNSSLTASNSTKSELSDRGHLGDEEPGDEASVMYQGSVNLKVHRDPITGLSTGRALIDDHNKNKQGNPNTSTLKLEPQDQAMALLAKYGAAWTVASYANALGVNRTAMYKGKHKKWAKFFDALKIARRSSNVPRGTKSKNGTIEAFDDD